MAIKLWLQVNCPSNDIGDYALRKCTLPESTQLKYAKLKTNSWKKKIIYEKRTELLDDT